MKTVDVTHTFPGGSKLFNYFHLYADNGHIYSVRIPKPGFERFDDDHRPISQLLADL